jgi:L-rhamnose mutarotase
MKRLCFACDLKDDPDLIAEYLKWHEPGKVWSEVIDSIKTSGVKDLEIYLQGTRLMLIMEVDDDFDVNSGDHMDLENPRVVEWEKMMWKFQQAVPGAPPDQKWTPMESIFKLP